METSSRTIPLEPKTRVALRDGRPVRRGASRIRKLFWTRVFRRSPIWVGREDVRAAEHRRLPPSGVTGLRGGLKNQDSRHRLSLKGGEVLGNAAGEWNGRPALSSPERACGPGQPLGESG